MLFQSGGAVVTSTIVARAAVATPSPQSQQSSNHPQELIDTHQAAYVAFGKVVRDVRANRSDRERASRDEENALLAICAYPAVEEGDRLAKARYLLEIEARGELDLPVHMQTLLRSTMPNR
ncbi:hypothetical protein ACWGTO_28495 [Mesorhizobium sp. PL10]